MENKWTLELHPTEEIIEEYCFNRLSESISAALEEHLLVCGSCQQTLQNLDEYILLMKVATAEYEHLCQRDPIRTLWEESREAALKQSFAWNALVFIAIGLASAAGLTS